MRKGPVLTGPDTGIDRRFEAHGGLKLEVRRASAAQIATADQVLAAVPGGRDTLLYARVDLVPGEDGNPVLMELELTEPQLYLGYERQALDRMATAIAAQARVGRDARVGRVHKEPKNLTASYGCVDEDRQACDL
jgi:hypothetical protein